MRSLPKILLYGIICCVVSSVFGQYNETQTYEKRKFFFAFDTDRSFFNGQNISFFGIKFGLQFDDKFRVGHGITLLNHDIPVHVVVNEGLPNEYITGGTVGIFQFSSFYERILLLNERWELTVPLHHGLGSVTRRYIDEEGNEVEQDDGGFMSLTVSLDGHYKVFSWIGVGAGLGYRFAYYKDKQIQRIINSPLYIIKMKLFIGTLYRIAFKGDRPWEEYKRKNRMKRRRR